MSDEFDKAFRKAAAEATDDLMNMLFGWMMAIFVVGAIWGFGLLITEVLRWRYAG